MGDASTGTSSSSKAYNSTNISNLGIYVFLDSTLLRRLSVSAMKLFLPLM